MKKKSLLTMVLALALVGAVGIGATLAYLSSTTGTLTNTFTVGNVKITQDEANVTPSEGDNGPRTETGNDYTDIQPGDELTKDPTVTVLAGSSDCYVFMQLAGADALVSHTYTDIDGNERPAFTINGFDSEKWIKVQDAEDTNETSDRDGVYRYFEVVKKSDADQRLDSLFASVTYDINATELAEGVTLDAVTIKSCAVQEAYMTVDTALAAATTEMAK